MACHGMTLLNSSSIEGVLIFSDTPTWLLARERWTVDRHHWLAKGFPSLRTISLQGIPIGIMQTKVHVRCHAK